MSIIKPANSCKYIDWRLFYRNIIILYLYYKIKFITRLRFIY